MKHDNDWFFDRHGEVEDKDSIAGDVFAMVFILAASLLVVVLIATAV